MKQLIRIFLLIICLSSNGVIEAYDFQVNGIYYNKISENEVEVTYNSLSPIIPRTYKGDIIIPTSVSYNDNSYIVTAIGKSAFDGCGHNVKSVTMPNTISKIDDSAFQSLWDITSIKIPESVISIGDEAFSDCQNIVLIEIPTNVISIGDGAFDNCLKLQQAVLHNSLKSIGNSDFLDVNN